MGRARFEVPFVTGLAETALLRDTQREPGLSMLPQPFAVDTPEARLRESIAGGAIPA